MAQNQWQKNRPFFIALFVMMLIAACGDTDGTPTQIAPPTPIAWQVVSDPITQGSAPNVRLTGRLDEHLATVFQITYSADGRFLATISIGDQRVIIWDTSSGEVVNNVGTLQPIWAFFSPSADYFYVIDSNQDISQWSMESGDQVESLRAQTEAATIGSITFGQNGNWVATAGERGQVYVIALEPFEIIAIINAHPVVPVPSIALSTDGTRLATIGAEKLVRIWDVVANEMLYEISDLTNPQKVLFAPDNSQLAVITDSAIRLYGTDDWALLGTIPIVPNSADNNAHFSADSSKIVTYGQATSVYVWDIGRRNLWVELPNHQRGVKQALFSADENLMLTVSGVGNVYLWDLSTVEAATSEEIDVRRAELPIPNNVEVHNAWWSPDSRLITVADFVGRVLILGVPQ